MEKNKIKYTCGKNAHLMYYFLNKENMTCVIILDYSFLKNILFKIL